MKKALYLLVFIYLSSSFSSDLYSQDWNLLNSKFSYNYSVNNNRSIITVRVDSLNIIETDTVYFLNRIVVDCDTCELSYDHMKYAWYDQPQFLQEQVRITGNSFLFSYPGQFIIKINEKTAGSWLFDENNNIQATVMEETEGYVFGENDSIKIIGLSTGDSIIISKNYGIVKFGSIYEDHIYKLIGINNIAGESIPGLYDIMDFNVGDIFEFHGESWVTESDSKLFIEQIKILSRYESNDTIEYDIYGQYYERNYSAPISHWDPHYHDYNKKLRYINSSGHPLNKSNNQLLSVDYVYHDGYNPFFDFKYSKLKCYRDEKGQIVKSLGSSESWDYFNVYDSANKILDRIKFPMEAQEISYAPGLGEIYYDIRGFEWWSNARLEGYVKGNDTVGTISDYVRLLSLNVTGIESSVHLFPNPVRDVSVLELPGKETSFLVRIFNIHGKEVFNSTLKGSLKLYRNHFKPGIYIYKVSNQSTQIYTGKFAVE